MTILECTDPKSFPFRDQKTIMSALATTQVNFPVLCIPRAMLFHTAEIVENAFNHAIGGKFVKSVGQSTTTDKSGIEFNVFFIHPDQDFKANRNTDSLYNNLKANGTVNISTGSGKYFWKVKLYIPHMKAQYLPPKPAEVPVPVGPRIMTEADLVEFRNWQAEKARKAAAQAAEQAQAMRNSLGERIYPLVTEVLSNSHQDFLAQFPQINAAGKITGMFLELSNEDILDLIENKAAIQINVAEGVRVLREHLLA